MQQSSSGIGTGSLRLYGSVQHDEDGGVPICQVVHNAALDSAFAVYITVIHAMLVWLVIQRVFRR
jgi:hypothetical protein